MIEYMQKFSWHQKALNSLLFPVHCLQFIKFKLNYFEYLFKFLYIQALQKLSILF